MSTVGVHPPKTPVTKGSNGVAAATTPNVCKMPGPPAPFVPTPLPNIGRSSQGAKGYSKKVKMDGKPVAIRGATFTSQGDIASKGTGGGLVSANTHGITKFITPGSMTVSVEGKAVHLLSEPMLNNCGPSGNPPNTGATLAGILQKPASLSPADSQLWDDCVDQHDTYKATQAESAAVGGSSYRQLRGKVLQGSATGTERVQFETMLDERIALSKRLHKERKAYIDMGCDKFDWTNNGTTEAERRAAHEGELANVDKSIKNMYALRGAI